MLLVGRPVLALKEWLERAGISEGAVFRGVDRWGNLEKRALTPQAVNLILKRRVKKLIEEEDASRPLTDEQITRILQSQGIQVTRRTVAKYREDMRIPSTHQRRVKK